jgi:hypothetical protein
LREAKEGDGWPKPVLLQMDERSGELDERFVKTELGRVAPGQPELLKDIMSFVEKLPVEAFEIPKIMGGQITPAAILN